MDSQVEDKDAQVLKLKQQKNSKLLQNLLEYKVETDPQLKRKIDYYYTPYNPTFLMEKHMKFDENKNEYLTQTD